MQNKMSDNDTERVRHSEKQNEPTKERVVPVRFVLRNDGTIMI